MRELVVESLKRSAACQLTTNAFPSVESRERACDLGFRDVGEHAPVGRGVMGRTQCLHCVEDRLCSFHRSHAGRLNQARARGSLRGKDRAGR
jgi:hypothetical protein